MSECACCGMRIPGAPVKTDLGPMHFDCWDRWHSSPFDEYPEHDAERHPRTPVTCLDTSVVDTRQEAS